MDLFTVTCHGCGNQFGLSDTALFEAQSLSCPACGTRMGKWEFIELKAAYFRTVMMEKQILSKLGIPLDEEQKFSFRLAGDPAEPEDARLLRYLISVIEEEDDAES